MGADLSSRSTGLRSSVRAATWQPWRRHVSARDGSRDEQSHEQSSEKEGATNRNIVSHRRPGPFESSEYIDRLLRVIIITTIIIIKAVAV